MPTKTPEERSAYNHARYLRRRKEILAKLKATRDPEVLNRRNKSWRDRNPDYHAKHRAENRDKINAKKRAHYAQNLEVERASRREYAKQARAQRYGTDMNFTVAYQLRNRLADAIRSAGTAKAGRTMELTGCTLPELMGHLQSLFQPGMHWNNRSAWHIDHRIPCAKFDLSDPEQQRQCFHFTNLQPLWKLDNLRKGARKEPLPEHLR